MEILDIVEVVRGFDGALAVLPEAGGAFPELVWGDAFFFFAPDGIMPERTQPYGTIITKNVPDDESSDLDLPGRFRVNIHVGRDRAAQLTVAATGPAEPDAFFPHPLYGASGWVCVVNPSSRTSEAVVALLRDAHEAARARAIRRDR